MIRAEGLTKIFHDPRRGGEFRAVDAVSFECHPGRIFGLLGPNGAGKTTTLRILSTALVPTGGQAQVDGMDVTTDPEAVRSRLGFLTGTTGIYERLTGREMIAYFGRLYGIGEEALRSRIEELLDMLDMRDFADTPSGKLSAGQKQKVSIARTIVHDPPVLIFDEPTTSLDILVARTVVDFIASCRERGRTVLLSTHIMAEAQKLCDDLAFIHEGKILEQGNVDEVCRRIGGDSIEDSFFRLIDSCSAEASA